MFPVSEGPVTNCLLYNDTEECFYSTNLSLLTLLDLANGAVLLKPNLAGANTPNLAGAKTQ